MQGKKPLFLSVVLLIALLFQAGTTNVYAQIEAPGVLKPDHAAELKNLREKAGKQADQNLNRYAIDQLQSYDQMLDSFLLREIKDSIVILEKQYKSSTGGRSEELAKHRTTIDELTKAKFTNLNRYNNLLRKAGIAFAAWLIIVLILLQIRKRHLRKQTLLLNENSTKLGSMLKRAELGKKFLQTNHKLITHFDKLSELSSVLVQIPDIAQGNTNLSGASPDSLKNIETQSKELNSRATTENRVSQFILSFETEPSSETKILDINTICDTAMEIASRGASYSIPPEFLIVTKDLEKNLPKIPVVPEAIHAMLLNILNNSFQAVKLKYDDGIKGYQPKVIMSTRILPRFLQIRIRDNGNGIPKDQLEKVKEEFYSLHPMELGAGLGLSDSIRLLGEPHKAELRLENDSIEGADIYIKFFLS